MTLKLIQNTHIHSHHDTITRNNSRGGLVVVKKQISDASPIEQRGIDIVKRCKRASEIETGNMRKIGQHFGREFSWLRFNTFQAGIVFSAAFWRISRRKFPFFT
jgi:hypothetical protein